MTVMRVRDCSKKLKLIKRESCVFLRERERERERCKNV